MGDHGADARKNLAEMIFGEQSLLPMVFRRLMNRVKKAAFIYNKFQCLVYRRGDEGSNFA